MNGRPYVEVIGDPIAHSKSPLIHNFWLEKLGIDAEYRKTHVRPDELADYFTRRRGDAAWRGCNVTMPHKKTALDQADNSHETADKAEAANTIVRMSSNELCAFNTDIAGVAEPLKMFGGCDRPYANHVATYVQVVGAGGAAFAAVLGAISAGYGDFDFYNRTEAGALKMANYLGLPEWFAHPLDAIGTIRNPDDGPSDQHYSMVVINATSLGMRGFPPLPIDLSQYYPDTIVFDMVYDPLETPLLVAARAHGLRTIDGLQMLVSQAAAAFELFFGQAAPREHDAELRALLTA